MGSVGWLKPTALKDKAMAIITKLNKGKRVRCKTRSFRKTLAWLKSYAHRSYRRAAKQAVKSGRDVNEKPRLTGWDIA